MSSFKGSGGISTARRVLRVSRTRESFDGSLHPPLDSQGTARSSGNYSQAVSRVHTTDLEAPLLEQRSTEAAVAAELATAAHAAEADARATIVAAGAVSGEPNGEAEEGDADAPPSSRPSLTGPGYTKHRDSRQLWRSARNNLGLSHREDGDEGGAYVVRTGVGAMQEAPSLERSRSDSGAQTIADAFVKILAGGGLGTGMLLRQESMAAERSAEPPGTWAPRSDARAVWHMLTSSLLNLMLVCLPLGIWAGLAGASPNLIFTANFLALIPLALFLGEVTEDLAVRFGDTVGGLLNATFGNVVELILSIAALQRGLYTVVATSLIGSILSNLLLVLGMCFFFGGLKFKEQRFSTLANKVSSSLLFLACIGIIIPTMARLIYGSEMISQPVLSDLSHAIALVLIFIYLGYLLFQLKTHADYFEGEGGEEEVPALSLSGALACLFSITIVVAICSEFLTGAIEAVSESSGINQAFLGLIVLPIAGNAAEHITAVFVAVKNKMDLSIAVALGSSIQIALFLIPVVVLSGWAMGKTFTLDFDPFAVLMLTVSVILAYFVSSDGTSNWLLGLQLVATYCLIGFVFLLESETPKPGGGGGRA